MNDVTLTLKLLEDTYGVSRLTTDQPVPVWGTKGHFTSITRTEDELSIVCLDKDIPEEVICERDWRIFKVEGPLDFSLVGILASISSLLADAGVSIFAISTFDTDYILVKEKDLTKSEDALTAAGYQLR